MNDTELDDLLDAWTAPPAPASLREKVRARFGGGRDCRMKPRRTRRFLIPALLAAAAILLVVAQAFPGPPDHVPYTVDSEFIRYAADGSSAVDMYATSYAAAGAEILRSRSIPDHPFETALGRTLDAAIPIWSRVAAGLTFDAATLERQRQAAHRSVSVIAGCDASCLILHHYGFARASACIDGTIVGHETILGHPATAVQPRWGAGSRMTLWMAPDLGCFALKITIEEQLPDGAFRLVSEKRAIHLNP